MPKVVGKTRDEATSALKEIGLEVKVEEEFSDDVEKNYIIKQEIKEETKSIFSNENDKKFKKYFFWFILLLFY